VNLKCPVASRGGDEAANPARPPGGVFLLGGHQRLFHDTSAKRAEPDVWLKPRTGAELGVVATLAWGYTGLMAVRMDTRGWR